MKKTVPLFILMSLFAAFAESSIKESKIELVRGQIRKIENELLETKHNQFNAKVQLQKIKKLLALQKEEISFSKIKIQEFSKSLEALNSEKAENFQKIETQKRDIRTRLADLYKLTQFEVLDASFLFDHDADIQKSTYIAKSLRGEIGRVLQLKENIAKAEGLEKKIKDERDHLETTLAELSKQSSLLGFNEQVQKELIQNNKSSVLAALKQIKNLRQSEVEFENTVSSIKKQNQQIGSEFALVKGTLPMPVEGMIESGFGKSYDSKKHLLTFQKGVLFKTKTGSEIRSVGQGVAAFVGPVNNYGQMVIVEHPGGYFTLYGQLQDVKVTQGALVKSGDVVGQSSESPFYFEIRNKETAMDPVPWFQKIQKFQNIKQVVQRESYHEG